VLLTLRSPEVHQGSTWSVPGGAIDAGETPHAAACREVFEELGLEVGTLPVLAEHVFECGGWRYTTAILAERTATELVATGWETAEVRWFDLDAVEGLAALHPAFAASWPALRHLVLADRPEVEPAATGVRR
jgi:8-oxo-dGTP pyrophosphatase MutT (NUDIX family)